MKTTLLLSAVALTVLTAPAHAASTVTVKDADKGTTVTTHPGDTVVVTLGSTAWTIDAAKGAALSTQGEQTNTVTRPGPGAPGTTSRRYLAVATGTATISASRQSCGEALKCTPEQAAFSVTLAVTPLTLPHTGAATEAAALAGLALLAVGSAAVVIGRPRRLR
jgi:LPXTG-motif cell wall-anchored protein